MGFKPTPLMQRPYTKSIAMMRISFILFIFIQDNILSIKFIGQFNFRYYHPTHVGT